MNSTETVTRNLKHPESAIPGVSLITTRELKLLDSLNAEDNTLCAILTVKAVFGGVLCEIDKA